MLSMLSKAFFLSLKNLRVGVPLILNGRQTEDTDMANSAFLAEGSGGLASLTF